MKRSGYIKSRSSSPSRTVEAAADALVQELTVARGACLSCGHSDALAGHHLIPRRFKKYRHHSKNLVCLCIHCHGLAHNKPKEFDLWMCRDHDELWRWWRKNQVRANQGLGPEREEEE